MPDLIRYSKSVLRNGLFRQSTLTYFLLHISGVRIMQTSISNFFVGNCLVEPQLNRITGSNGTSMVEPKVMHVLICLAEQPGEVLTKDALIERVWEGTVVTDYVISRSISQLRKLFGDSYKSPQFIETVSKTGYRLIAPVTPEGDALSGSPPALQHGDSHPKLESEIEITPGIPPLRKTKTTNLLFKRPGWKTIVMIACATATIAWIGGALSATQNVQPLDSKLFTSTLGTEVNPVFSPDGSRIAFIRHHEGGQSDIYVKMIGATTELRITDDPASDLAHNWSPDGKHLIFQRISSESCAVFQVSALGGEERKIMDCSHRQHHLNLSPDGSSLLIAELNEDSSGFRISSVDIETEERIPITTPPPDFSDSFPTFSPSGQQVAFCRGPRGGIADLYVVSVSGGTPRRLTSDDRNVTRYTWAPDGRSILFSSNRAGDYRLWRVDVQSGDISWVSNVATLDPGGPSLSPTGDHLAYEEWIFEINIWEIDVAKAADQELKSSEAYLTNRFSSTRWDFQPHFSPDGEQVAFVSNRSGRPELWVGKSDGSDASPLTSLDGTFMQMPRWSPDGSLIAFDAFVESHRSIYVVDAQGGKPRRLSTDSYEQRAPRWSVDGEWIYFASNREDGWQIWKMPAEGGAAKRVTQNGGYLAESSKDGITLYYSKLGKSGLWRKHADGVEELVVDALHRIDWGNWTLNADGLYFVERKSDAISLTRYDITGDVAETIATLPSRYLSHEPGLTVSPNGDRILFAQTDRLESDIMLVSLKTDK